jgi:hypothetical protein
VSLMLAWPCPNSLSLEFSLTHLCVMSYTNAYLVWEFLLAPIKHYTTKEMVDNRERYIVRLTARTGN